MRMALEVNENGAILFLCASQAAQAENVWQACNIVAIKSQ